MTRVSAERREVMIDLDAHIGAGLRLVSTGHRLKICLISETLHAGVGRHLVDIVRALSARGHEIHLVYSPIRVGPSFLDLIRAQPNVFCHSVWMPHRVCWGDVSALMAI